MDLRNDEAGSGGSIAFARAPFGAIFELITYSNPLRYEEKRPLRRWKPPSPIARARPKSLTHAHRQRRRPPPLRSVTCRTIYDT